jgi:formylglycine-generating enzyme required for sulfatase activity
MGDMIGAIVSETQAVGKRRAPADRVCAVPGGEFWMGSNDFYEEERPLRRVRVEGFRIDECPVTNDEFAAFVADTGTSPMRRFRRLRRIIPVRPQTCCVPVPSCSSRRAPRCRLR